MGVCMSSTCERTQDRATGEVWCVCYPVSNQVVTYQLVFTVFFTRFSPGTRELIATVNRTHLITLELQLFGKKIFASPKKNPLKSDCSAIFFISEG